MIAASAIAGITALRVGPSADGSDRRRIDAVPNAEVRLLPLDELHDAPLNGSHCSLSSHSARVHRHKTFRSLIKLFAECIGGFSTLGRLPCLQFAIDWTLARPCVLRDAFEQINETLGALIARPAMQRGELTLIVAPLATFIAPPTFIRYVLGSSVPAETMRFPLAVVAASRLFVPLPESCRLL